MPSVQGSRHAIPVEVNEHVQKWIDYFTGRGRHHMEKYLERSTRYRPMIEAVMAQQGLPKELVYLALIESGFSWRATSSMSAVGLWQFISSTGRFYGLQVDSQIDERRDPILATHAAARYLRSLYTLFGSWYLAIASYNVGENKMKRVVMKHHTRDYWELVRRRILPRETLNYVPKFTAARIIGENPEKYGFTNLNYMPPMAFEEITAYKTVSLPLLSKQLGVSLNTLKELNPSFRQNIGPVASGKSRKVRVPEGYQQRAMVSLSDAYVRPPQRTLPVAKKKYVYYKVKRGETLHRIAKRFGTTVAVLQNWNRLRNKSVIYKDQLLRVPASAVQHVVRVASAKSDKPKRHRVARGETLIGIATKYGVSLSSLRDVNDIRPRARILAGSFLRIP